MVAVQMRAESSWDECSGGMREDERRWGGGTLDKGGRRRIKSSVAVYHEC